MATNSFNLMTALPTERTPFLANNGNPNTVYNTAASPFATKAASPFPVATGVVGALPATAAPPATPFYRNMSQITPATFNLGDVWGASGAGWGAPTPPVDAPVPTTPDTTNPFDPPIEVDGPNAGAGVVDLGRPGGSGTLRPSAWTNIITDRDGTSWNMPDYNSMSNMFQDAIRNVAEAFGANGFDEGKFDFNQFVDAISEPFLRGNLYNENVGRWNGLNILEAIVDRLMPGGTTGFGARLTSLVERMFPNSRFADWVRTRVVQNNVDDAKDRDNYLHAPQDRGGAEGGGLGDGLGAPGGPSGVGLGGWGSGGGRGGGSKPTVIVGNPQQMV